MMKIQLKKLNFYLFFGVVAKNRAFGNDIIILQQFFRFGGFAPDNPLSTPLLMNNPDEKSQEITLKRSGNRKSLHRYLTIKRRVVNKTSSKFYRFHCLR